MANRPGARRRIEYGADNETYRGALTGLPRVEEAGTPPAVVVARIPAQVLVVVLAWVATSKPTGKG